MEPWGYVGGALPGWPQHPAAPGVDQNEAGESVESTPHAMEKYTIPTPELPPMSLLRRKVETLDK